MRQLPNDYVVQKFYQFAGYPKYKRLTQVYEGGCPTCREGNSWGRKRRLYYITKKNLICCHNCGLTLSTYDWVKTVGNISDKEILEELSNRDFVITETVKEEEKPQQEIKTSTLPEDSINLCDISQVEYYKDEPGIKAAIAYIKDRKLDIACNNPKDYWISLKDKIHKNRLIIPFYDNNKIVYYQSRTIMEDGSRHFPKYLSKMGAQKSLFNIDNVDASKEHYYVFEGPINACFCKNSIAVAGIQESSKKNFTVFQEQQLKRLFLMKRVWVLDSQWLDNASRKKTKILLDQNETVFIWPKEYGTVFKDFNDIAKKLNLSEVPERFILDNSYDKLKGNVKLGIINYSSSLDNM